MCFGGGNRPIIGLVAHIGAAEFLVMAVAAGSYIHVGRRLKWIPSFATHNSLVWDLTERVDRHRGLIPHI